MKFQSFIKYFDWIEEQASSAEAKTSNEANGGNEHAKDEAPVVDENGDAIKISRKVFGGKQWLTIEDWLECNVPLCPLDIKHEGRIDRSHENIVQTVFASSRLGGDLFSDGWSQVSAHRIRAKVQGNLCFVLLFPGMFTVHNVS